MLYSLKKYFLKKYSFVIQERSYIISTYLFQGVSFVFTLLIANKIAPVQFGIYGLAILIETYLHFLNLGLNLSTNKVLAIDNTNKKGLQVWFYSIFYHSALISVISFIYILILNESQYNIYVILFAIYMIFNYITQANIGVIRSFQFNKYLSYVNSIGSAVTVGVIIYYVVFADKLTDATPLFYRQAWVLVLQGIFSFLVIWKFVGIKDILKMRIDWKYFGFLILQGILLSGTSFLKRFFVTLDRLFIASFFGTATLGYYSVAQSLINPFALLKNSIFFLDYSKYMKEFNKVGLRKYYTESKEIHKRYMWLWMPLFLVVLLFGYVVTTFFLKEYQDSFWILIFLFITETINIYNFSATAYMISNDLQRFLILSVVISIILNTCLNFIVVGFHLSYFLILANTLLSNFVLNRSANYFLKRKTKFEPV